MNCPDVGIGPAARAYEAQNGRLQGLVSFLAAFAPAIGERSRDDCDATPTDSETSVDVLLARESAVLAAFRAVESIAAHS